MRSEFQVRLLNDNGLAKAVVVADQFSNLLDSLEGVCGRDGRDMAIVKTKLEEAAFFAKRAVAMRPENQRA